MKDLVKFRAKFYMSYLRTKSWKEIFDKYDNVSILPRDMTDEFGLLMENGKILVIYFDEQEE